MGRERPQSIEIPVRGSNEVVEVFLDELPMDPSEIRAILRAEEAPIELFLSFAGKEEAFTYLIREGLVECSRRHDRRAEVPLLTALAAHHIRLALRTDDMRHFEEATMHLNEGERHDQSDAGLLLRKGLLLLAQKKLPLAEYHLKMSLTAYGTNNVAAHIAMGAMHFLSEDYRSALTAFQTALRRLPSGPETLRLAIGCCLVRLGQDAAAGLAFERAVSLCPSSSDALLALAILHLNRGPKSLAKGMQLLKQAYECDKNNAVVLFHLSNHFFFKRDFAKATTLATAAAANARTTQARAAVHYILGKIAHAQGDFASAFTAFNEAVKFDPTLPLVHLGLGQCYLYRENYVGAAECFERVVQLVDPKLFTLDAAKSVSLRENMASATATATVTVTATATTAGTTPTSAAAVPLASKLRDSEFWAMVGMTFLAEGTVARAEQALRCLERARSLGSRSFDLFISLAHLQETRDPCQALASYRQAQEIDRTRFLSNPQLLNNYAVIAHLCGDPKGEARHLIEQAVAAAGPSGELGQLCRFNQARLYEDQPGEGDGATEAEQIYRQLLLQTPGDVVLHLRLGMLCAKRGSFSEAADHYKEAIGLHEGDLDAWVLLASNHMRLKAITPARKAYERILKQHDRHDAFSLVALGTIYVDIGRHDKRPASRSDALRRALEFFIKALQLSTRNFVAANGVGVVLAELGRYKEAKDVFIQVRQAAPVSFVDATLNLAHCFVELGQYPAAISAYEGLLERASGISKRGAYLLFLARAIYIQAKAEKNPTGLLRAIGHLETATALLPGDLPIQYNIALCQQELAALILKREEGMGEEELDRALNMLDRAEPAFTHLSQTVQRETGEKSHGLDAKILDQRGKYCSTLRTSLQQRHSLLQSNSFNRQERLEAVRQQRAEHQAAEEARLAQEALKRQQEQEANEAIRRELAARLKATEDRLNEAAAATDDDGDDDDDKDDVDRSIERDRPRKRQSDAGRSRRRTQHETISREEESEEETIRKRRRRMAPLSKEFISSEEEA